MKDKGSNTKKILGIAVISLLVINVLMFAFRIYGPTPFWIVILLGAMISYVFPKINAKKK